MNATLKLAQMGSPRPNKLFVYKGMNSDKWLVEVEGTTDGMSFKAEGSGSTLEEATNECHRRWLRFVDKLPELQGALPPPEGQAPTDYQDADHMVRPSKPGFDDDIPF